MKKSLLFVSLVMFVAAFTSCKKELSGVSVPTSVQKPETNLFIENGHIIEGWYVKNPFTKVDPLGDRIVFQDSTLNDAYTKLNGIALPKSDSGFVYAVDIYQTGNLNNMRAELERRGWVPAGLEYFLALNKEWGIYWNNNNINNLMCLKLPAKINFGTGDENAGALYGSPYYYNNNNPSTNGTYNMAFYFIEESSVWGNGMRVLCKRK